MTPSEKLDAILSEGREPQIHEVMDCEKWPWVCPHNHLVRTKYGNVSLMRGRFYNGSSGPKIKFLGITIDLGQDIVPDAFASHDDLWRYPWVWILGVKHRIGFITSNRIYGAILRNHGHKAVGRLRRVALFIGGWPTWKKYRRMEKAGELNQGDFFVPHPQNWDFPSWRMRDARWIGTTRT